MVKIDFLRRNRFYYFKNKFINIANNFLKNTTLLAETGLISSFNLKHLINFKI